MMKISVLIIMLPNKLDSAYGHAEAKIVFPRVQLKPLDKCPQKLLRKIAVATVPAAVPST